MLGTSAKINWEWRNPKIVILLVALVLLAVIVVVSILRDRFVNQTQWQVQVVGEGRVAYQPDIAIVNLGVQVERVWAADSALKQLNDKMNKVVAAIKGAGIAAEDIQTQNYNLQSQTDYRDGISIPLGYLASQQLLVKVRKITEGDVVSKVIAAATSAGANQVNGITFDVSNLNDLKQEARIKALADAKERASSLADAAGVRLGKVVGWWDNIIQAPGINNVYYGVGGEGKGGGGVISTPQIPTATQEIIIDINLSYLVK